MTILSPRDSIGGYTCEVTNDGGSNTATATLNVQGKDIYCFVIVI